MKLPAKRAILYFLKSGMAEGVFHVISFDKINH